MAQDKNNFSVFCTSKIDKDADRYSKWSDGIKMFITKNGVTIVLDENEVIEVAASLPRTIGGSY